jgi:hypothetical protein
MSPAASFSCPQAELAISCELDGLLSRRERRELSMHVRGCGACTSFRIFVRDQRRALRVLRIVPVPRSLQVFRLSGV